MSPVKDKADSVWTQSIGSRVPGSAMMNRFPIKNVYTSMGKEEADWGALQGWRKSTLYFGIGMTSITGKLTPSSFNEGNTNF